MQVDYASLAAPFFEGDFCAIPPELAPWVSYAFVIRRTTLSNGYVFSRLPESTVHVGFFSGLDSGGAPRTASLAQQLLIAGPQRRLWRVPFPADEAIDIALSPAGARALLGVPLQVLTDQIIDAEELWGDSARQALERVSSSTSTRQRLAALFELIRSRRESAPDRFLGRVRAALAERSFDSKVSSLAAELGYSERQLRRKCLEQLGLAPKELCRVVRIQSVLRQLTPSIDWARCAADFGYCDQAHLLHEFREFVGASPRSFIGTLAEPRLLGRDVAVQPG